MGRTNVDQAQKSLNEAKANIEITEEFKFALPKTRVPNGKVVVRLEQIGY